MGYTKQTFIDNETVLSASHLNHIEDGIVTLENDIKNKVVGLTEAQVLSLDAMFQNAVYDVNNVADHFETYYDFRYNFGLDSVHNVYVSMLENTSFTSGNELFLEKDCMCAMFNCKPNTRYTITDKGTHNRFRFYGRTTRDSKADAGKFFPMHNVIADKNTNPGIDSLSAFTINSGNNKTIYMYLVGGSTTHTPNISVVQVS